MKDEVGDVAQGFGWAIDLVQGFAGVLVGCDCCRSRVFQAVQGRVGCFVRASVFARGFAEVFGSGGYVEEVVGDLEQ